MTRGEGLGNILTLFEKIQGEQRKRQEVREDRAYRSGMAKWMEEARAQEGRQQTELKFMFEQMGNLEQQYAAEQKRLTTLGLLTTDKDTSEGFRKLLSDSVSNVQKRANTLSGRMKQHSTQMERLLGTVRTQQERIGKAQETFGTYQRGFTDDALAASIYEMGKTVEGEKGIEAMRLDSKGAEQAWKALVGDGKVDPVYKKGVIAKAMNMNETGIKQALDLRRIQTQEAQVEAYKTRTQQMRKDADPAIAMRKAYAELMEIADDAGDKPMYLKAKGAYNKLLPYSIIGGETKNILDMPQDVIDSIVDVATQKPEKVNLILLSSDQKAKLNAQQEKVQTQAKKTVKKLIDANLVSEREFMPSKKMVDYIMDLAKGGDDEATSLIFQWEKEGTFKKLETGTKKLME